MGSQMDEYIDKTCAMCSEEQFRNLAEKQVRLEARKIKTLIKQDLAGDPGEALGPLKGFKQSLNTFGGEERVIFNGPATILYTEDGGKYVSKCSEDDIFDPVKGYLLCKFKEFTGARNGEISRRMDEIRGLHKEILGNELKKILQRICAQMEKIVEENKSPSEDPIEEETTSPSDDPIEDILEGAFYDEKGVLYALKKVGGQPSDICQCCAFEGEYCSEIRRTACQHGYIYVRGDQKKAKAVIEYMNLVPGSLVKSFLHDE